MIDPTNVTRYDQSYSELEEFILFWVCAAGKNGVTAARSLENLIKDRGNLTPFEYIKSIDNLPLKMKNAGIGCYGNKARTFKELVNSGIDLKTCDLEELESIYGIGKKTSRCFMIHSRRNQKFAGLDRHALSFLADKGHKVPKSTPLGKQYLQLEKIFLGYVEESGKTISEFDLDVWMKYSGRK